MTVLPKIACFHTQDVYIGALIVVKKKNEHPVILVDRYGRIVTYNRKADDIIFHGEKKISEEELFLMVPRVCEFFQNSSEKYMYPQRSVPMVSNENIFYASEPQNNSRVKSQNSLGKSDEAPGPQDETSETLEAYFIGPRPPESPQKAMPADHESQRVSSSSASAEFAALKLKSRSGSLSQAQLNWRKLRLLLSQTRGLKLYQHSFAQKLRENLKGVQRDPDRLRRVNVQLVKLKYQDSIELRELEFISVQKTSFKVQAFFREFTEHFPQELAELLMLSPPLLNSLYKLNVYKKQLEIIEKHILLKPPVKKRLP